MAPADRPQMAPLLGQPRAGKRPSSAGAVEAVVLIGLALVLLWEGVHALSPIVHIHPLLAALFPVFTVFAIVLVLVPTMYLSFRSEFGSLHPLWPPHFLFLARRLLRALNSNGQLKVSAKEL